MKNSKIRLLFALLALLFTLPVLAQTPPVDNSADNNKREAPKPEPITEEQGWVLLKAHVEKESALVFDKLTAGFPFRKVSLPEEEALVKKIADRISRAAGRGDYTKPIAIAKMGFQDVVNALTFPGGQMIYLTGLLNLCRERAQEMAKEKTPLNSKLGANAFSYHYENLIAAVVGHELGHYFGQHFMRRIAFSAQSFNNTNIDLPLEKIRYGQEHELEADEFSLRIMKKAGYDPGYIVEVLKLLKLEQQKMLKTGSDMNPYLLTHPSGNARLAEVASKAQGKEFFERMAKLEMAFASIETGSDLDRAAEIIDKELALFPKNTYLLAAAARIYHRRWEASCTIDELLFKVSIAPMSFHDEMVPAQPMLRAAADGPRVPGEDEYFYKAKKYYRLALQAQADLLTQSSLAALLIYEPKQDKEALKLAELAAEKSAKDQGIQRLQILNNLGIVYYFVGDYHSAEQSFKKASGVAKDLVMKPDGNTAFLNRQRLIQGFSERNTGSLFEAYFNFGQLYHKTGFPEEAKRIWTGYLTALDWRSDWAKHAAVQIDVDLKKMQPGPAPTADGIGPGTTIAVILVRWGEPTSKTRMGINEVWNYPQRGVEIATEMGLVKAIKAAGNAAPPLSNGVYVKMKQADVERKFGEPTSRRGSQVFYPRSHFILTYDEGLVSQIIVIQ